MGDYERIRLVLLGGPKVGKSAILKRFLFNTFTDRYKATVEDLYNKEYFFDSLTLKVDFLDSAGDLQFPAMRRLSIATAHAFLLVYSIDDTSSFDNLKRTFEEIREQRADFTDIPIVVAGNKKDLINRKTVESEQVSEWVYANLPKFRGKVTECSAKDDTNVAEIFKTFLDLSKIPIHDDTLKRRSSAYEKGSRRKNNQSEPSNEAPTPSPQFLSTEDAMRSSQKPRSRSLIRRSSRKAKQQVRDASASSGGSSADCHIS